QGSFAYTSRLSRQPSGRYAVITESDLRGLAIDLPKPVGKRQEDSNQLKVQWMPAGQASDTYLNVQTEAGVHARMLHREGVPGPYFLAGFIGTSMPTGLPAEGLSVDARYPEIDVARWKDVVDDFSTPLASEESSPST